MADPFALMNRAMEKGSLRGGRQRPIRDPNNPADAEYLRAMHPDFDEIMNSASMSYKSMCQTDAKFATKFQIPPMVEPKRSYVGHSNSVDAVSWGPGAGNFVSASHDGTLRVWEAASGRCLKTLTGHAEGVYHCEVAKNQRLIVSCGSGQQKNVLVWQWPEGQVCRELAGHRANVHHVTLDSDSRHCSTTDKEGTVAIHDVEKGTCLLQRTMHLSVSHGSSFCREDANLLISVGQDGAVQLWDLREATLPATWQKPSCLANSVLLRTSLSIWDAHGGQAVYAADFSGRTSAFSVGADHKLKRWDLRAMAPFQPECVGEYLGHTSPIRSLCVADDLPLVVTGCEDGSCRVWQKDPLEHLRMSKGDVATRMRKLEEELKAPSVVEGVRKQLQQELTALKASTKQIREGEAQLQRNGYSTAELTLYGHVSLVSGVAWSKGPTATSSHILTSSWDQTVKLFELDTKELM